MLWKRQEPSLGCSTIVPLTIVPLILQPLALPSANKLRAFRGLLEQDRGLMGHMCSLGVRFNIEVHLSASAPTSRTAPGQRSATPSAFCFKERTGDAARTGFPLPRFFAPDRVGKGGCSGVGELLNTTKSRWQAAPSANLLHLRCSSCLERWPSWCRSVGGEVPEGVKLVSRWLLLSNLSSSMQGPATKRQQPEKQIMEES